MADSGNGNNVIELLPSDELDQEALRLRLLGWSIRRIAKALKLTDRAVLDGLDRVLPVLSPETQRRLYREDLFRLEELIGAWHPQAKAGSAMATDIVLKLLSRRAAMVGLDAPKTLQLEVIEPGEAEGSTQQLLALLDAVAAEGAPAAPEIEIEGKRTS